MPAVPTSKDFEKLQKYSSPSVNPRQHVFTRVHQVSIVIKQQENRINATAMSVKKPC